MFIPPLLLYFNATTTLYCIRKKINSIPDDDRSRWNYNMNCSKPSQWRRAITLLWNTVVKVVFLGNNFSTDNLAVCDLPESFFLSMSPRRCPDIKERKKEETRHVKKTKCFQIEEKPHRYNNDYEVNYYTVKPTTFISFCCSTHCWHDWRRNRRSSYARELFFEWVYFGREWRKTHLYPSVFKAPHNLVLQYYLD